MKDPSFKIEADYVADPIWCEVSGFNLDIDDLPLSEELKDELNKWLEFIKKYLWMSIIK